MKKKLIVLSSLGLAIAPFLAFAQVGTGGCANQLPGTLQSIICTVGNILNTLIPIMMVLAIVYFIWGVIQYVISSDEEAKKSGKDRMIWGIIGLVAIVAVWGLVAVLTNTFGLTGNANVNVPTLNIK